jgi:hypothetical protein
LVPESRPLAAARVGFVSDLGYTPDDARPSKWPALKSREKLP